MINNDKYFFNYILIDIKNKKFEGKDYKLAQSLGLITKTGKIQHQQINKWTNCKISLSAKIFFRIIEKIKIKIDFHYKIIE